MEPEEDAADVKIEPVDEDDAEDIKTEPADDGYDAVERAAENDREANNEPVKEEPMEF